MLTAAGAPHGRIVLLTVPAGEAVHPHSADYGLAGIDLYTRDITDRTGCSPRPATPG